MIYSRFSNIFTTFSILLLLSCCDNRDSSMSTKIDHIKTIGDTNAILALEMLDSLDTNIRTQSEDVIKNMIWLVCVYKTRRILQQLQTS